MGYYWGHGMLRAVVLKLTHTTSRVLSMQFQLHLGLGKKELQTVVKPN